MSAGIARARRPAPAPDPTELAEMCGVAANLALQVQRRLPPEQQEAAERLDQAIDQLLAARAEIEALP
ncbi:MAG: hypothetical protein D6809_02975 [Gammaproteobacteria bacterium]|nr:MAG: hypothetical protein D6809_02975 [Gammaproteobacteria bacterium]